MTLNEFIQLAVDNYVYTAIVFAVLILIYFRLKKTIRIHLGARRYVKKSKKLRRKKYNGIVLSEKLEESVKRVLIHIQN